MRPVSEVLDSVHRNPARAARLARQWLRTPGCVPRERAEALWALGRAQHELDRRRNRPSRKADAWAAAGARAEPINPDPDLPADDDLAPPDDDPRPSDDTDIFDPPRF